MKVKTTKKKRMPEHKERMLQRKRKHALWRLSEGTIADERLRTWCAFWRAQHAKSLPGSVRRRRQRALDNLLAMDGELY